MKQSKIIKSSSGRDIRVSFDYDMDYKIWKAKGSYSRGMDLINHPLIGRKIFNKDREPISDNDKYGNIGIIEQVLLDWFNGYYISILVSYNGSHGLNSWINVNCEDDIIIESIPENHKKLEYIWTY